MLAPILLTALLAQQAPSTAPSEPVAAAQAPAGAGQAAAPVLAHGSALAGSTESQEGPVAKPARVDTLKPWMRVWYWPPTPETASTPVQEAGHPYQGIGDYSGGPIDPIRFPTNRTKVVDNEAELHGIAVWLVAHPAATVTVEGYADRRGSSARNRQLSEARAEAVKNSLVAEGVEASRIKTLGHGAANPTHGETVDEGFWLSRRVTLEVTGA